MGRHRSAIAEQSAEHFLRTTPAIPSSPVPSNSNVVGSGTGGVYVYERMLRFRNTGQWGLSPLYAEFCMPLKTALGRKPQSDGVGGRTPRGGPSRPLPPFLVPRRPEAYMRGPSIGMAANSEAHARVFLQRVLGYASYLKRCRTADRR